ncbi:hypothetical protein CGRA01v4_07283 [Colletotrichum graminicola]|nr:hypothetical protein CGRA01v4_07283 [Colletotrichum graminicola]
MQRWRLTPTTIVFILFLTYPSCTLSLGRPLHARPWPLTFILSFPTPFSLPEKPRFCCERRLLSWQPIRPTSVNDRPRQAKG